MLSGMQVCFLISMTRSFYAIDTTFFYYMWRTEHKKIIFTFNKLENNTIKAISTLQKTLSGTALASLFLFASLPAHTMEEEPEIVVPNAPRLSLLPPFDYQVARRAAMANNSRQFTKFFRGGAGLQGGIDVTLANLISQGLDEGMGQHIPGLVPHMQALSQHIQAGETPNSVILHKLNFALQHNQVTPNLFLMACIHGGHSAPPYARSL